MFCKEDFAVIKALHQRGVYQKDIAAQLEVASKMVGRAFRRWRTGQTWAERDDSAPRPAYQGQLQAETLLR